MLSRQDFSVLHSCFTLGEPTQRALADATGFSLGSVNATLHDLKSQGLIAHHNAITQDGLAALEPYKVDNAIIMAAGLSSRFAPISYEKPKGVLTVRGEVLLERQIRQLQEAGIDKIIVVVGYKKNISSTWPKNLVWKLLLIPTLQCVTTIQLLCVWPTV